MAHERVESWLSLPSGPYTEAPHLPPEIILSIIDCVLDEDDGFPDDRCQRLHPLTLISQDWNRASTPLLYHAYINSNRSTGRPIRPFLRAVIRWPHLAAKVHSVSIRPWLTMQNLESGAYHGRYIPESTSLADRLTFCKAVQQSLPSRYGVPIDDDPFGLALLRGCEDAEIILLMSQLPNLEKIILFEIPGVEDHPLNWNDYLSDVPYGFIKLKTFVATVRSHEVRSVRHWPLQNFSFLFSLPNLSYFEGTGCKLAKINRFYFQPNSSSITHLRTRTDFPSLFTVEALLLSIQMLKVFEYSSGSELRYPQ